MFWIIILYFFDENRESYCRLYLSQRVTRNMDSNYEPIDGRKNGSLTFCSRIWLGNIYSISWDHSPQNQILGKKIMLFFSYSWALIALKICWKVTFDNRFHNNFWMMRNSLTRPECYWKNTFGAWIWTKILNLLDGNTE